MSRPAKYIPGDLVFAKVKGYPPWPARVTSVKSSRYKVFFYGTFETATLKKEDIWPYNQENEDKFAAKNLKRKGYSDGLDQIKNTPEIAPVEGEGMDVSMDMSFDTSVADNTDASLVIDDTPKLKQTPSVSKVKKEAVSSPKSTPKSTPATKATPSTAPKTKPTPISSTPSTATPATARGNKRKANDSPIAAAPPVKRPSIEDSPAEQEKMSRSGRVIKPKKFDDDVISSPRPVSESGGEGDGPVAASLAVAKIKKLAEPKTEADSDAKKVVKGAGDDSEAFTKVKSPKIAVVNPQKSEKNEIKNEPKEPRKMWVKVKSTSDLIEINLDKSKPENFESKEAEVEWQMRTARNAIKFKNKVESGEFIPKEIRERLEQKEALTPKEKEMLKKEEALQKRKEKLRWLKIEQRVVDLDISIKTSLHMERPSPKDCILALDDLNELAIMPLMIKKQPDIVTTIRRLRKYVGPQEYLNWPDKESRDTMVKQIDTIQTKADMIYNKFKSIFAFREGDKSFWEEFDTMVQEFKKKTEKMEESQILALIRDPTTSHPTNANPLSDLEDKDEGHEA